MPLAIAAVRATARAPRVTVRAAAERSARSGAAAARFIDVVASRAGSRFGLLVERWRVPRGAENSCEIRLNCAPRKHRQFAFVPKNATIAKSLGVRLFMCGSGATTGNKMMGV
jgi:hypothetical protein